MAATPKPIRKYLKITKKEFNSSGFSKEDIEKQAERTKKHSRIMQSKGKTMSGVSRKGVPLKESEMGWTPGNVKKKYKGKK